MPVKTEVEEDEEDFDSETEVHVPINTGLPEPGDKNSTGPLVITSEI